MGMSQWHKKAPKQSKKKANNSSGLKAEETKKDKKGKDEDKDKDKGEEKPYSMPESIPTQSMDIDDTDLSLANRLLSATPGPSSAMTASNGLLQDWVRQSHPSFPQTGCYDSAGVWDVSSGYYCGGQSDYVEQSSEATWANASTFPEANLPVLNTNPTATGSINTPWCPSRFYHQNIYTAHRSMPPGPSSAMMASNGLLQHQTRQTYPQLPQDMYTSGCPSKVRQQNYPGQGPMSAGSYPYGQPTTGYGEQRWGGTRFNAPTFSGANIPAQNTINVGPGNLTNSGYPLVSDPQSVYSSAAPTFDLSTVNIQPSYNNNHNHDAAPPSYPNPVPAPSLHATLGGYNRPDPSRRYGVDDFWDQEMGRQELPPINIPAQIQATPQPVGPRRVRNRPVALPPPVRPAESSNSALSSPARDPFMGAEYSPVLPEDQMNADGPWGLDDWL